MADKFEKMNSDELYELGNQMIKNEDMESAAKCMKLAADKGNLDAMCAYGVMLYVGEVVEKDEKAAVECWQRASDAGSAKGDYRLAVCCFEGIGGCEQNYEKAFEYFTKAAEGGVNDAYFNLAYCTQKGIGTKADEAESIALLKKAADLGVADACFNVGMYCMIGQAGFAVNYEKAVEYLTVAAEAGIPQAQFALGGCNEFGQGTEKNLAEAAGWYRRAAKAGIQEANKSLQRLGFPTVK